MSQEEYTTAELDAVLDLIRHPGYALVRKKLEAELERRRDELEKPMLMEGTSNTRGKIEAIRMALNIPQILISEIKTSLKENE